MAMLNLPSGIWVCLKWGIPLTVDFNGENGNGPLNFGGIYIFRQSHFDHPHAVVVKLHALRKDTQ